MSTPTFNTRHTLTGKLQRLTEGQIRPFARFLEIVPDDAKPYEPGMFKPGEVGEHQNPDPTPDAVADAQSAYDAVLKDHAPNTAVAREAKKVLDDAKAEADAKAKDVEAANTALQEGEPIPADVASADEETQ